MIISRLKGFGCVKLLWKVTQKESFIFLLRNESYLIIGSWYWRQSERVFYFSYQFDFTPYLLVLFYFLLLNTCYVNWLLLCILIFQSDCQQYLLCFLIASIWLFHSLADNTKEFSFSTMELNFFQLLNGEKISSTWKRNYCVLSRCACAKLKIFLSAEIFLNWTVSLKRTCKIRQSRNIGSNGQCTAWSPYKGVQ